MQRLHITLIATGLLLTAGFAPARAADIDALCQALAGEDAAARAQAAKSLAAEGPEAAAAVDALTEALADDDAKVRAYAAYALGEIGQPASVSVEALMDRMVDEDGRVRRAAMRALQAIDPPREQTRDKMLQILKTASPDVVVQLLEMIAGEGKTVVPKLRVALQDEEMCYWACVVLSDMGPEGAEALPELLCCLDHDHYEVRLNALIALGEIGQASEEGQAKALEILKNEKIDGIRYAAVFALGKIGAKGDKELNRTLVELANGDEPILKMMSLWALARLNPEEERVVRLAAETIVQNLKSEDPQLRSGAARALAEFEAPPEIVAPQLVDALKDTDPQVVGNALDALAALGAEAVPNISRGLTNPELRHYAARVIFLMGPEGAGAVPALAEALAAAGDTPDDVQFRHEILMTLAELGPLAKDAIPALIEGLSTTDLENRALAAFALGKMGQQAREAVPALREKLREQLGSGNPTPIVWALLNIVPDDAPLKLLAVPLLQKALSHREEFVRAEAARMLGKIGAPAAGAIEDIKKLQDDPSPMVQDAATAALEALQQ